MNIRHFLKSIFQFPGNPNPQKPIFPIDELLRQATDPSRRVSLADIKKRAEIPKLDASLEEFEQTYGVAVWVYACLSVIAEKSASVKWQWEKDNEVQDGTVSDFWQPKPNPMMSWNFLRQTKAIHQGSVGNAYWWIKRENTADGFDVEYFPLQPSRVRVVPSKDGMSVLGYAYRLKGEEKTFGPRGTQIITHGFSMTDIPHANEEMRQEYIKRTVIDMNNRIQNGQDIETKQATINKKDDWMPIPLEDMIHFRDPHSFNLFYGMPPLQPLVLSIMTDLFGRQWNRKFFENSAIPPIVISLPEGISEEDFDEIVERWNEKHKDVKKAWTAHFQEGAVSVHVIDLNHTDMDFLNQLRASREDVLAALNVPPLMVGIYEFCLRKGTRLQTPNGSKNIEDIKTGDWIYSSNGKRIVRKKVTQIFTPKKQKIYRLSVDGKTLEASGNHPILTTQWEWGEKAFYTGLKEGNMTRMKVKKWRYEWTRMDDLQKGDYVVVIDELPKQHKIPDGITLAHMEFFGAYLGDGSIHISEKRKFFGVGMSLPINDPCRKYYENLILDFYYKRDGGGNKTLQNVATSGFDTYFNINSVALAKHILRLGFGRGAKQKRIPSWVYQCPEEYQLALLRGLVDTDGSVNKRGWIVFNMSNLELVRDIKDLCICLGLRSTNITYQHKKEIIIDGKRIGTNVNGYDCYILHITSHTDRIGANNIHKQEKIDRLSSKQKPHRLIPYDEPSLKHIPYIENTRFRPVKSIEETNEYDWTYDIEVEGQHNFVAEGIVVHNSNTSGRSAGAEQQRQNFWKDNIIPKQNMDEEFINDRVDFGDGIELDHDHDGIAALQPDDKDLAEAGKNALQGGLTVEETRERIWKVNPDWEGTMLLPVSTSRTTNPDGTVTETVQYGQVDGKKKDLIEY